MGDAVQMVPAPLFLVLQIPAVITIKVTHSSACERVGQQLEPSMILGMSLGAFTILHVIITLVAIGSGLIVVGGMFASHRLPVTTHCFS